MGDSARELRAGREDPTRPERWSSVQPQAQMELPTLSSVLLGNGRKLAVLDGRVMAEGETRAGMKLWKVESDRVVLSMNEGAPLTVRLDKTNVIKEKR
jgi:MSHA biogenesis protein MshK